MSYVRNNSIFNASWHVEQAGTGQNSYATPKLPNIDGFGLWISASPGTPTAHVRWYDGSNVEVFDHIYNLPAAGGQINVAAWPPSIEIVGSATLDISIDIALGTYYGFEMYDYIAAGSGGDTAPPEGPCPDRPPWPYPPDLLVAGDGPDGVMRLK